ncbi:hypothetical protein EDC17_101164 [Sphingobacterium alimentarium]|uniref:Lysophospholipase L1-like esterase n=1 Tax=Sphingobacterium alimentarium TaxID=797292 RepID=A0A4R3VZE3_9SPHI|nr:SGNH/GDSL hydrolase family protein [Sphingobacterium alimentarium]TCV17145.1 hypothetical protein EDC17_101164 [Sphingobacterium alimentarium]
MAIEEDKIVRFPEGTQDVPFEDVNYVMAAGPDGKFKRISKNALKIGLTIENGRMQSVAPGALPAGPTGQTRYMEVTAVGTWTYGGVEIGSNAEGYQTTFWWDGTSWSKVEEAKMPMPEGVDHVTETGTGIPIEKAVFRTVKSVDDKVSAIAETEIIEDAVFDGGTGDILYDDDVFRGWGTNYGVLKNFNRLKIHHKDISSIIKVTKLRYRVCENDRNGAVLANGEVDVDFSDGQIGFITIDLSSKVSNPNNSNIWLEFWGNGNMAFIKTDNSYSTRKIRYQTTSMSYNDDFSQDSIQTSVDFTEIPDVKFILLRNKASVTDEFANEVLSKDAQGRVETGNRKAVSGDEVKLVVKPFEDLISDEFISERTEVISGDSIVNNSSTFAGWGQDIGIRRDFNAISYDLVAYDNENLPTYLEMRIRNGSSSGAVLFTVRVDVAPQVNIRTPVVFELPSIFTNPSNLNLFVQFNSDGYFASIGSNSGSPVGSVKYTTTKGANVVEMSSSTQQSLGMKLLDGSYSGVLTSRAIQQIKNDIGTEGAPRLLLTSRVWLYPGLEYNVFDRNVCVPEYGDNIHNYRLDYNGSTGNQFKRGYRLNPVPASLDKSISLILRKGKKDIATRTQRMLSAAINAGSGITRKILQIGDSTILSSKIGIPLKAIFESDVMNLVPIGTIIDDTWRHEGRGGYTIDDYYGYGRILYRINVSGLTTTPTKGTEYSQGSSLYIIEEVNITSGSGYFSIRVVSGIEPAPSGTLTKSGGTGDDVINYTSMEQTSANVFRSPVTNRFDIGYYLSTTGQTLSDNDWITFQLGINDVFGLTNSTDATNKVNSMIYQLKEMISNIRSYNPLIRIGIVVTFPPADQDAFGDNDGLSQTYETYLKIGLAAWQSRLIAEFDNDTSINNRIYLISAHLNLDAEYNYPSAESLPNARYTGTRRINMQTNGVHPNSDGNAQIADMYAGLIKYFG